MRLLHSRNSWSYSHGFQMGVDFCIWVLLADGLRVPPFDQHDDGDGSLRALGFNAANWRAWLANVAQRHDDARALLQGQARNRPPGPLPRELMRQIGEAHMPVLAWNGDSVLRDRLSELWEQYGPLSNERKRQETPLSNRLMKAEQKSKTRLYDELLPYAKHLPTLMIHFVDYPKALDYLIPPVSLVMSIKENTPDVEGFRLRVLAAASELAARNSGRRRGQSMYRSAPEFATHAFLTYPPSPLVSSPAPVTRPIRRVTSDDPLKQLVLDWLADAEHIGSGEIDLANVQFLREKAIPGWQIYMLTFTELDGEQHCVVMLLKQAEDGTWRFSNCSSYTSFNSISQQFIMPIHDHPYLVMSGGGGYMNSPGEPTQYNFEGYGEVVDNGFDVTRVVLLNDAGVRFEDTVQDGWVCFVSSHQQKPQQPTRAELYDRSAKLVWEQEVFAQGLPFWLKPGRPPSF